MQKKIENKAMSEPEASKAAEPAPKVRQLYSFAFPTADGGVSYIEAETEEEAVAIHETRESNP